MDRFDFLFQQYLNKQASVEERLDLQELLRGSQYDERVKVLIDEYMKEGNFGKEVPLIPAEKVLREVLKSGKINQSDPNSRIKRLWIKVTAAAAIVALAFFINKVYFSPSQSNQTIASAGKLLPGGNAATLTLSDGKKIKLNDLASSGLIEDKGIVITRSADGQITYRVNEQAKTPGILFNSLSTGRGETYKVRLPDGTLVCLNSLSTLTYPTAFTHQAKRRVELYGEGYFEVAKDKKHPFIVTTAAQDVEVLGTHFNINAYNTELSTKTTLIEGSVKILPRRGSAIILKPGQQAFLNSHVQRVIAVETQDEVAWKNGFFSFNNQSIENIMTEVSRWYHIDVRYDDESVKNILLFGSFSKFDNFGTVVKTLERTKLVKFTIIGNKVTLSKTN